MQPTDSDSPGVTIPDHVLMREIGDEGGLVLHLDAGRYFALNPSAGTVLTQVAQGADRDLITAALVETFDADEQQAAADTGDILQMLLDPGIVQAVR